MSIKHPPLDPVKPQRSEWQRRWRVFARNRTAVLGLIMVLFVVIAAIFADDWFIAALEGRDPEPLLALFDPTIQSARDRLTPPDGTHLLGRDSFGRDVWSRIIYGARVSLMVGLGSILIGGSLGMLMGLVAGFLGGAVENTLMRAVDVLMAFPSLIMGLMVLAVLGGGLTNMVLAIGIVLSPTFARVAHGATLAIKNNEFVTAATTVGASRWRIIWAHIMPNIMGEMVVLGSIWAATAIRVEANLSFIGLGVSPPTAAWGSMIRDGTNYLRDAPWVSLFPGLAILLTVLAFNLLGDGLRDILDPRSRE